MSRKFPVGALPEHYSTRYSQNTSPHWMKELDRRESVFLVKAPGIAAEEAAEMISKALGIDFTVERISLGPVGFMFSVPKDAMSFLLQGYFEGFTFEGRPVQLQCKLKKHDGSYATQRG